MNRMLAAALMTAGALVLSLPAMAEEKDPAGQRAATVRGRGLDLTKDADAGVMLQRLRRAASGVCGVDDIRNPTPAARRAMDACVETAVAEAVAELDAPALTRQHADARAQVAYRR